MLGSMSAERGRGRILPTAPGSRVTRVELFYDLVFVFAFLNVTNVLSETLSGRSLLAGLLLLLLLCLLHLFLCIFLILQERIQHLLSIIFTHLLILLFLFLRLILLLIILLLLLLLLLIIFVILIFLFILLILLALIFILLILVQFLS